MASFADKLAKTLEEVMARTDHPDETYCILMARSIGFGVPQAELVDAIGSLIYVVVSSKDKIAEEAAVQVAKEFRRYGIELPAGSSLAAGKKPGFASMALAFLRRVFRARQG